MLLRIPVPGPAESPRL